MSSASASRPRRGGVRSAAPWRDGCRGVGVAQPLCRQRHQAVRRRWRQAARRSGSPHRGRTRCARRADRTGGPGPSSTPALSRGLRRASGGGPRGASTRRAAGRGRRSQRRRAPVGAEVLRAAGAEVIVIADPDGRNINDGCGATAPSLVAAAVRRARRRRRHRPRRRRRPSDRGRPHRRGGRRRPHHRDRRRRPARVGRAARRHGGRHGDDQPRFPAGDERGRHHVVETAVGDRYVLEALGCGWLLARRRTVGARDLRRPRHDRRRPAHRAGVARRGQAIGPAARRARRRRR